MTKINPYDLPSEEERSVRITLFNINWDAAPGLTFPPSITVPVDSNLPEEEMIAKAMDIASDATGCCILDCEVQPIYYGSKQFPKEDIDQDSLSDTLDYVGEIF